MIFQQFCNSLVTTNDFSSVDVTDQIIPDEYTDGTKGVIECTKHNRDVFDRIELSFVESAFRDRTKYLEKLANIPDGEIPDGIINKLSSEIFKTNAKELNVNQQAIIKVLAIYICIS